jgi:hypothetical protein
MVQGFCTYRLLPDVWGLDPKRLDPLERLPIRFVHALELLGMGGDAVSIK